MPIGNKCLNKYFCFLRCFLEKWRILLFSEMSFYCSSHKINLILKIPNNIKSHNNGPQCLHYYWSDNKANIENIFGLEADQFNTAEMFPMIVGIFVDYLFLN